MTKIIKNNDPKKFLLKSLDSNTFKDEMWR